MAYTGKAHLPTLYSEILLSDPLLTCDRHECALRAIPKVIRGINAFTLGVRQSNPDAKVKVVWTNTWFDPQKERQAAEALVDGGADMIAQHQDTPGPQQAAEARGAYGVGYNADMSKFAPRPC